jgi:hypothetical protein
MGCGYKSAIYPDIFRGASFAVIFRKCVYVSVGNGERTKYWEDDERDKGISH